MNHTIMYFKFLKYIIENTFMNYVICNLNLQFKIYF